MSVETQNMTLADLQQAGSNLPVAPLKYRDRNIPDPQLRMARVLTLDERAKPHPAGTVITCDDRAYMADKNGSFRRVVVVDQDGDKVRVKLAKRLTRKEKKAAKRRRHHGPSV